MQFEEAQVPLARELALDLDAPPTPNVNDTLYLRYAIDQLTRHQDIWQSATSADVSSDGSYPVVRVGAFTADEDLEYPDPFQPRRARRQAAAARFYAPTPELDGTIIQIFINQKF